MSPSEHVDAVNHLLTHAEVLQKSAKASHDCERKIENLGEAIYLLGKAKTHAEESGSVAAMDKLTKFATKLDRTQRKDVKRCFR